MGKVTLRSLIVLPDDTARPLLDAIRTARESVRVKVFALSDPPIVQALIAAHRRGVKTRVMVERTRTEGDGPRAATRQRLQAAGIEVRDANPAFSATHEKSVVVDAAQAFVQSCNWERENFTETRDYAVRTRDLAEVGEIIDCFEADWARQTFTPKDRSNLIWSPWNGRERVALFIDQAKDTLVVQNERFQDAIIVEHLVRARVRGVKVRVFSRAAHSLSVENLPVGIGSLGIMHDVGIKIRKLQRLKLHAKMVLADGSRAIVGSINMSSGSFDKRRELAIEVSDPAIVDRLKAVAQHDWKRSHPLDLSEAGIMADLERHHMVEDVLARLRALKRDAE